MNTLNQYKLLFYFIYLLFILFTILFYFICMDLKVKKVNDNFEFFL